MRTDEERTFQLLMSRRRLDFTTHLVFADWLEEHNDPRAEGYRVMGTHGCAPKPERVNANVKRFIWFDLEYQYADSFYRAEDPASDLPRVWLKALGGYMPSEFYPESTSRVFVTAAGARDAAALAYASVSEDHRKWVANVLVKKKTSFSP